MDYADRKTLKEIRTKGISKEKFETYLKELGLESLENTTVKQVRSLMKVVADEYKTGGLSLDEMSSAFDMIHAKTIYDNDFSEVNDILEMGEDLSYYERVSAENEPVNTEFVSQLRDVLNFSEKTL